MGRRWLGRHRHLACSSPVLVPGFDGSSPNSHGIASPDLSSRKGAVWQRDSCARGWGVRQISTSGGRLARGNGWGLRGTWTDAKFVSRAAVSGGKAKALKAKFHPCPSTVVPPAAVYRGNGVGSTAEDRGGSVKPTTADRCIGGRCREEDEATYSLQGMKLRFGEGHQGKEGRQYY